MDASAQSANPAKLFVGNLSYNITSEQLTEKFSQFGTVVEALVMTDKFTGRSKGFGFVTMSSADEANACVTGLNESEWDGRNMVVNVARPRVPRENRGFGGGAGGYNGGSRGGGGFNRGGRDFSRGSDRGSSDRGGWNN
ncbi:MAG: RNA-binding protein [Candidatus Woesebacteria bacterium]